MSDWKRSGLCLCRSVDVAGCGHCLRASKRKWTNVVDLYQPQVGRAELPLLSICQAALERRKTAAQTHILILHDTMGEMAVSQAEDSDCTARVHTVEVCALDRIGHVDVLLALAMGFDHVLLQKLVAPETMAIQHQEVEMARAMGGNGRLDLFGSVHRLAEILQALPEITGPWRHDFPVVAASRRATARSCAAVLLPTALAPVPLPADAPYGTVQLDESACTMCQSCVWLCPTDALSIGEHKSELLFVESSCIQCGMCRSICPEDALQLMPRLDPLPRADARKVLHKAEPFHCTSCGEPFVAKSMMDRLLARIWGGRGVQASEEVLQLIALCSACQTQEIQEPQYRRQPSAVQFRSEARRRQ